MDTVIVDLYNKYKNYLYLDIKDNYTYRIKSPRRFCRDYGGVCYDYVVAIADELEKADIPYQCFYTVIHKGNKTIATHTYIIIEPNIWMECAWKSKQGLYEVNSYKDIENELLNYYHGDSAFTVKYNPLDTVNMSLNDFYSYLESKAE